MDQPCHGYTIKKKMTEKFDVCTTINNNSLYSALKRYEKMGAITKSIESTEGKPNRIVYTITSKGKKLFVETLRTFPDSLSKNRDEYMMRLYYFHLLDTETRIKILNMREQYLTSAIESIEAQKSADESIFMPQRPELSEFHLGLLNLEQILLDKMKEKVNSPCAISDEGELI
ncbi:MAG: hypothetical protein K0R90_98 [Oscillospiraceae bacterium]|jgi:DNA-binding PadR family transcriptional regulator|nr:hypothetical protein [Oscillospiraceae bacterium]